MFYRNVMFSPFFYQRRKRDVRQHRLSFLGTASDPQKQIDGSAILKSGNKNDREGLLLAIKSSFRKRISMNIKNL